MAQQTEFVLRNDGFWYAPPISPYDELDYNVRFAHILKDDTIEEILSVTSTDITVAAYTKTDEDRAVTVWLNTGINRKTATVKTTVRSVGGRTIQRTFKIEVMPL